MIRRMENQFERWLQTGRPNQTAPEKMRLGKRFELAIPLQQLLDNMRSWRDRLSPEPRRIYSAGQLLFQVIGVAGYAGYFASMHTLMRLVSGVLVAGTWYAIYRIKGADHPKQALKEERLPTPTVVADSRAFPENVRR